MSSEQKWSGSQVLAANMLIGMHEMLQEAQRASAPAIRDGYKVIAEQLIATSRQPMEGSQKKAIMLQLVKLCTEMNYLSNHLGLDLSGIPECECVAFRLLRERLKEMLKEIGGELYSSRKECPHSVTTGGTGNTNRCVLCGYSFFHGQ